MHRLLAPTLLLLVSAAAPSRLAEPARLRVLEGHTALVVLDEVEHRSVNDPARTVEGSGYAEAGIGSRFELAWAGRASLSLEGPASVDWDPPRDAVGGPSVRLGAARRAELEVRHGRLALELPGAWELDVGRAALSIERRPGGVFELRHRAGAPVELSSLVARDGFDGPLVVRAGARLRLAP